MDTSALGELQGRGGSVDICGIGTGEGTDDRFETALDISTTLWKSPGLEMGKPASITSTPRASSSLATMIFSTVVS